MDNPKLVPEVLHAQLPAIISAVQRALLEMFGELKGMEGRNGAAFVVTDLDGTLIHFELAGSVARKNGFRYGRFAIEKASRIGLLCGFSALMERSRESADQEIERYQGAVIGDTFIWSISGYTAAVDELGAIAVGHLMDDIDISAVVNLAEGNDHDKRIDELLKLAREFWID